MGKYYCDYCDIYLTHDSMSARKAHNTGRNHLNNVRDYFNSLGNNEAQSIIDQIVMSHENGGRAAMMAAPSMRLGAGFMNPMGPGMALASNPTYAQPPPIAPPFPPTQPGYPGAPPQQSFNNAPPNPFGPGFNPSGGPPPFRPPFPPSNPAFGAPGGQPPFPPSGAPGGPGAGGFGVRPMALPPFPPNAGAGGFRPPPMGAPGGVGGFVPMSMGGAPGAGVGGGPGSSGSGTPGGGGGGGIHPDRLRMMGA